MITYQEELYDDIIEEMKPLFVEHYHEVAMYQDKIDLNPDYVAYKAMADAGVIHFLTVRDEGKMIGYTVTLLHAHPHYKDHDMAVNDILYVHPDYRHGEVAPTLLSKLEQIMKQNGVSVMTFHMKTHKPFETLMSFLAYDKAEALFMKYIKED